MTTATRRKHLVRTAILLTAISVVGCDTSGTTPPAPGAGPDSAGRQWLAAWGTTRESVNSYAAAPRETTVRNIVRVTAGGSAIRLRFFNLDPERPVAIGAAAVGIRQAGTNAAIRDNTARAVTFDGGHSSVLIPPNTPSLYSDPIALPVANQDDLAVSLYIVGEDNAAEFGTAWNESYKRPDFSGDATTDVSGEGFRLIDDTPVQFPAGTPLRCNGCRPYVLRDVEVLTNEASGVMLFLGSSSFHGFNTSQDAFKRVSDLVSVRMRDEIPAGLRHTVITRAIAGDTLEAALRDRMEVDVWSTRGLQSIVAWVTNDLSERSAEEIIDSYRQLLAAAHDRGVQVYCPTWIPGAQSLPASLNGERMALNDWILNSGECDGVADYNGVVEAPGGLTLLPQYNSGDFVHSNDAGHAAWAEATPLAQWLGLGNAQ